MMFSITGKIIQTTQFQIFIAFIVGFVLYRLITPESPSLGKLELDVQSITPAVVRQGSNANVVLILSNFCNADLRIDKVTRSCGCLLLEDTIGVVIEPGQQHSVAGVISAKGRRVGAASTVTVHCKNASGEEMVARNMVAVEVVPDVFVSPPSIDFGTVAPGESAILTLVLTVASPDVTPILRRPSRSFSVSEPKRIDSLTFEVDVAINASQDEKNLSEQLMFATVANLDEIIPVHASARIGLPIHLQPSEVYLSPESTSAEFLIQLDGEFKGKSIEAMSTDSRITVRCSRLGGEAFAMQVDCGQGALQESSIDILIDGTCVVSCLVNVSEY